MPFRRTRTTSPSPWRTRRSGAVAALAGVVGVLAVALSPAAQAYQVATTTATLSAGVGTLTMPVSGLSAAVSGTGLTSVAATSTLGSRGYVASDFTPTLATATPSLSILTNATNNCPAVGTCSGLGTLTVTFSQPVLNPVLNLAGIGGDVYQLSSSNAVLASSQLHDVLTLTTGGLTLTDLSGGNLAVSGNQITAADDNASYRCETTAQSDGPTGTTLPSAQATAACGSVRVNGVVTTLTFTVSAVFVQTTPSVPAYTNNTTSDPVHNQDGWNLAVTVAQDFGDAPSSYDQGNAAAAVLSNLKLGAAVTEDNATVANGTVDPNASATAATDAADDGVTLAPMAIGDTTYSVPVTLSGATRAGTVCGWVDFNKNGIFDNPAERACASFAAGATTATLSWSGIPTLTEGDTYARFRIGYNTAETQSPIGASDSGEVEDYKLTIMPQIGTPLASPGVLPVAIAGLGGVVLLVRRRALAATGK